MLKAQHTIVSPSSILTAIQKHYPGIHAYDCQLLALGCNDNYHIKAKRQDYAFRLYRLNWWPEKDIDEELRFLEAMHRRKLNVCKPVRANNQQRYIKLKSAEGIRFAALFKFIEGNPLSQNFVKRNVNLHNLGELVARMHSIADSIKPEIQRWQMDFDAMVTPFINNMHIVLGHREKDMRYLQRLSSQLEETLLSQPADVFNHGLCHGDLHLHNVMLQPDGELSLFDFDWSGYSWRAYDLATIWWSLPRQQKSLTPWRAFLRGYQSHTALTKQDKQLMPWFVILRQFEYLNFQLSMRPHIGTAWLNDNYYDFNIGFFKNWIKLHIKK